MGRKSKQKEAILRAVKNTLTHPTAEWVYQQVKHEIPNISLGTVYRNLKLLTRDGVIRELGSSDAVSHFDGNTLDHFHFRCEQCKRILDMDLPPELSVMDEITRMGFKISRYSLELQGICRDCR